MYKKQIALIVAVVIVIGYLYHLPPVKGNTEAPEKKGTGSVARAQQPNANVTVASVSVSAKTIVGDSISAKITGLENKLKDAASDADKLKLEKTLAKTHFITRPLLKPKTRPRIG